eukprot:TRINITY_DN2278_c0_g6_i1.p1 TRINITY_DN2278_c0_g6~~TRINITY_DN2278_c0_g6_i1.p1  ORF type:complete len:198 (+),score=18.91 TRINITY_DN2278_c0_g6_i1:72-665(+)
MADEEKRLLDLDNRIIQDLEKSPFSRDEFRAFLKLTYEEENLDFVIAVQRYALIASVEERWEEAKRIFNTFVRPNAEQEINISATMRNKITELLKSANSDVENVGKYIRDDLFKSAEAEVTRLLQTNSLPRFIKHAQSNIGEEEALGRLHNSIFFLALFLIFCIPLMLSSSSRFWRFFAFPFANISMWCYLEHRNRC